MAGNPISVKAGKVPGQIREYGLEDGATISDVLREAGLVVGNFEVRLNGNPETDLNTEVEDGDSVTLLKKIKGN